MSTPTSAASAANPPTYRIRNWEGIYENHGTRKVRTLAWVATPNKHDGRGFRRLMRMNNGLALYGAWHLILQVASKMPLRGTLADIDGPLTAQDIADKTGAPVDLVESALQACSSPEIAWIDRDETPPRREIPLVPLDAAALHPDAAAESPDIPGESAAPMFSTAPGESAAPPGHCAAAPGESASTDRTDRQTDIPLGAEILPVRIGGKEIEHDGFDLWEFFRERYGSVSDVPETLYQKFPSFVGGGRAEILIKNLPLWISTEKYQTGFAPNAFRFLSEGTFMKPPPTTMKRILATTDEDDRIERESREQAAQVARWKRESAEADAAESEGL